MNTTNERGWTGILSIDIDAVFKSQIEGLLFQEISVDSEAMLTSEYVSCKFNTYLLLCMHTYTQVVNTFIYLMRKRRCTGAATCALCTIAIVRVAVGRPSENKRESPL